MKILITIIVLFLFTQVKAQDISSEWVAGLSVDSLVLYTSFECSTIRGDSGYTTVYLDSLKSCINLDSARLGKINRDYHWFNEYFSSDEEKKE